ncbi:MAG: nitroreductase [Pseudomonadota bacterium]
MGSTITQTQASAPLTASEAFYDRLMARRSVKAGMLRAPGPTPEELQRILTAGTRVPDHGKVEPWRFIAFEGDARRQFGDVLAQTLVAEGAQTGEPVSDARLEIERERFERAPLVLALITAPQPRPNVPPLEQTLSCGAVGMNVCHAANALGFASVWLTEWYAYSVPVHAALGLAEHEAVAGFIYIGTADEAQSDRARPDVQALLSHWSP